jgi:Family of unknown function (DUF6165)
MGNLQIEISIGEALDRLSILKIKLVEIKDEKKVANVAREYENLKESIVKYAGFESIGKEHLDYQELIKTNYELWKVEDQIRLYERAKDFSEPFIELARKVYVLNDKRASIKKQINLSHNSQLIEEKSYEEY